MDYKRLVKNIVNTHFEAEWRKAFVGITPTPLDIEHFDHVFSPYSGFVRIIDNTSRKSARDLGSCAVFSDDSEKLAAREHKVTTPITKIEQESDVLLAVTLLVDDLCTRLQSLRQVSDIHFEMTPPMLAWHEAPTGTVGLFVFCSVFALKTYQGE